jgi:hypothetical protein
VIHGLILVEGRSSVNKLLNACVIIAQEMNEIPSGHPLTDQILGMPSSPHLPLEEIHRQGERSVSLEARGRAAVIDQSVVLALKVSDDPDRYPHQLLLARPKEMFVSFEGSRPYNPPVRRNSEVEHRVLPIYLFPNRQKFYIGEKYEVTIQHLSHSGEFLDLVLGSTDPFITREWIPRGADYIRFLQTGEVIPR